MRAAPVLPLACVLALACAADEPAEPRLDCTEPHFGPVEAMMMEREDWVVVMDAVPFPVEVRSIAIGAQDPDNFNNRGDVEVRVDGPEGVITVEARRFAAGDGPGEIADGIEHLSILASTGPELSTANDCATSWADGCRITVHDERGEQAPGSGADLRVTLPASYDGSIDIETADALAVDGYFGRGDVRVWGSRGDLDVKLDGGEVLVYVDREARPGATACTAADVLACETWTDPESGEADPWSLACPCLDYGRIQVGSRCDGASSITVDLPAGLWATVIAGNDQPGLTADAEPSCSATLDCPALGTCRDEQSISSHPWRRLVELNDPNPAEGSTAVAQGGLSVSLRSARCEFVDVHPAPGDFPGPAQTEKRGDVQVCSGCLEALLP